MDSRCARASDSLQWPEVLELGHRASYGGMTMDIAGIYPPLPTFFAENEDLDLATLREHVTRLRDHGITRFVALGSNGEAVHLDHDERRAVIVAVREAAGADAQV